jgi:DNA-binding GntR family transcriptional regulator
LGVDVIAKVAAACRNAASPVKLSRDKREIILAVVAPFGSLEYVMPAMTADKTSIRRAAAHSAGPARVAAITPQLEAIDTSFSFKNKAYAALKNVIVSMDIYRSRSDIRLDERKLAQDFGVSRTPVREAMAQLEREGFVRAVPRRGIFVVRKTKREVIEMITAWAALEGMAARLITQKAADEDIASLRRMFATFVGDELRAHLDEYSEVNIQFHQAIISMSGNSVLIALAENLFTHMRMIRMRTIGEEYHRSAGGARY